MVSNQEALSSHVVDHIKNFFSSLVGTDIYLDFIKDSITNLISQEVNQMLKKIPSDLEIKEAVFNLNKDGALGPDGFRASFVQHYWDIIHHDVIKVVKQFFISYWIMPNYNMNTLILLPKVSNADSIELFRPII